jgi:hypothetical protein
LLTTSTKAEKKVRACDSRRRIFLFSSRGGIGGYLLFCFVWFGGSSPKLSFAGYRKERRWSLPQRLVYVSLSEGQRKRVHNSHCFRFPKYRRRLERFRGASPSPGRGFPKENGMIGDGSFGIGSPPLKR